jgi:hypothetical protein
VKAPTLHHVSEDGGIGVFEPRLPSNPAAGVAEPVVWAVDADHLANYLLPRDCPRVAFAPGPRSTTADVDRFVGQGRHGRVVTVEQGWMETIRTCRLYCYDLPAEGFVLQDAIAGYWLARRPVAPLRCRPVSDAPAALADRGAELRVLANLWELHDAVAASSLDFSMIRMRNAAPPIAARRSGSSS